MINEHNEHELTAYETKKWNEAYEKGYEIGYMNGKNEQNPAWSEEDEKMIENIVEFVDKYYYATSDYKEIITWLKSIKERVQPWQKREWSKEAEEMFDAIIADIQFTQKAHTHEVNQVVYEREIDWLKSIKERYTWKPSEEQIGILVKIINFNTLDAYTLGILQHLYQDLKKLK